MRNLRSGVLTPVIIFLLILLFHTSASADILPQKPAARLGKGSINTVAYSPDGKVLAAASGIGVWLYNSSDLSEIELLEHARWINSVAFSPGGKLLASGGCDRTICLWDVSSRKLTGTLGYTDVVKLVFRLGYGLVDTQLRDLSINQSYLRRFRFSLQICLIRVFVT